VSRSMPVVNLKQFAETVGFSVQQVSAWAKTGMPAESGRKGREAKIDTAAAIQWLKAKWEFKPDPDEKCDQRERLARVQADRHDLANAVTRGELVYAEMVRQVASEAVSQLAGQL